MVSTIKVNSCLLLFSYLVFFFLSMSSPQLTILASCIGLSFLSVSSCSISLTIWRKRDKTFFSSSLTLKQSKLCSLTRSYFGWFLIFVGKAGTDRSEARVGVFTKPLTVIFKVGFTLWLKLLKAGDFLKAQNICFCSLKCTSLEQGILQGEEVSLYHWPPVWLVWKQLYDNWQFLFLLAKQTNQNQSNRRSMVQWYFPL